MERELNQRPAQPVGSPEARRCRDWSRDQRTLPTSHGTCREGIGAGGRHAPTVSRAGDHRRRVRARVRPVMSPLTAEPAQTEHLLRVRRRAQCRSLPWKVVHSVLSGCAAPMTGLHALISPSCVEGHRPSSSVRGGLEDEAAMPACVARVAGDAQHPRRRVYNVLGVGGNGTWRATDWPSRVMTRERARAIADTSVCRHLIAISAARRPHRTRRSHSRPWLSEPESSHSR